MIITKRKRITKMRTAFILFILCISRAWSSFADDEIGKTRSPADDESPWQITAQSLVFNEKEGLYIAEGAVNFTKTGRVLSAQEAVYNTNTGMVELTGDVRFESGGDILTGERGVFNLHEQTGKITKGRLFLKRNHFYVSGDSMEKVGEETYLIRNFLLTSCDGPSPAWSITGSEIKVTIEGYGKIKHWALRVHDIPFFYFPYMIFPAKTTRQSGLLPPRFGYSDRNGADAEVPIFWAISDSADATFYERYMSRRGLMQGLEFRYVSESDSKGTYLFDILSDKVEEKDLDDPDQADISPFARTNRTRYWLRSRTDQQLPGEIRARLDTDVVSDQDYLKEFSEDLFGFKARPDFATDSGRPLEEINSPTRRSALRFSRDQQDYSLQAVASYHQRPEGFNHDETVQPLAGLDFTILPRPLTRFPLAFSLDTNYDYVWRDFGQKGHTLSITPTLSYPAWIGPYVEFEPSVSLTRNTQWLENDPDDTDLQSRTAYQFQGRFSTFLERIYEIEGKRLKKLKHKFIPSLTYQYRVHRDEHKYQPWFEPIDIEGSMNRITLGIDNLMDSKKEDVEGNVTYTQWGTLSFSQGYRIDETNRDSEPWREGKPFDPLVTVLRITPFEDLNIDAEAHWDHYEHAVSFADLSFALEVKRSGGRKDSYGIDYSYLKEGDKGLNYYLNVNLFHGFSGGSSLNRDMELGRNIDKSYWLEYTSQCWGIRLILEKSDEGSRVNVTFRLLGLGDLKGS